MPKHIGDSVLAANPRNHFNFVSTATPPVDAKTDRHPYWVRVVVDLPLQGPFDYRSDEEIPVGTRVIVPFGRRKLVGMVVECPETPAHDPDQVKAIESILRDVEPMEDSWLRFARFAADYYQRPLGEVILPALPQPLRRVSDYQGKRSGAGPVARLDKRRVAAAQPLEPGFAPALNQAQQAAVDAVAAATGFAPFLLFGVTGSGKTEVYLHAAQQVLAQGRNILMLVPEINLTPQFERALRARLEPATGPGGVAVMHSGLADGERLRAWLRVRRGQARVVLGTRLAIFAPVVNVGLIVVDEEHDPSYKQQDGLRYSARDLAVWRGRDLGVPVILGSATPSLESWVNAERGHYRRLDLTDRARDVEMPTVRLVDTRRLPMENGMSPQLLEAMRRRLDNGEQVLVYLNRRGYAPALHCASCGWVSQCPRCTAYTVLHRGQFGGHQLHCHHCGYQRRVPPACPDCGDQDLQPMGRGTQRIEEHLAEIFPQARVARIDADTTRLKGSAQALFDRVHAHEIDILVGTQMVAKGHDFANLGLVGVLNADAMLFSQDFRAPERLFAQLMQVSGRAGRHTGHGEVIVQTGYPEQTVYQALVRHDFAGYARHAMRERESASLPPYSHQALLTAESRELPEALAFLQQARASALDVLLREGTQELVSLYDPVPFRIVRVAHVCRAQLLVEATQRSALHTLLRRWVADLNALPEARRVRWQLEVDPLEI